ncbi:hypothetical protein K503DRAFT_783344 [Rhizopogon vinicolor AM-OR11-026]|uniref:Uncharacterized protein n=1 Tax=Rhizopogon vinicolor AM-OR11-026 TaxID=1314800 RepID=A0A1B7MZ39_9AGAM|nr:hypothetical protein K503DRAFT_783344 [Rhizopogon vinicolor AM-OR11-026]
MYITDRTLCLVLPYGLRIVTVSHNHGALLYPIVLGRLFNADMILYNVFGSLMLRIRSDRHGAPLIGTAETDLITAITTVELESCTRVISDQEGARFQNIEHARTHLWSNRAGAPVRYLTSNIQMLESIALWQGYHFDLQQVAIEHGNAMSDGTLNLLCKFHCSDKERTERYLSR